jgi:hypothetical protein
MLVRKQHPQNSDGNVYEARALIVAFPSIAVKSSRLISLVTRDIRLKNPQAFWGCSQMKYRSKSLYLEYERE